MHIYQYSFYKIMFTKYKGNMILIFLGHICTFAAYFTFWGKNLIALDLDRVCNERCILRTTEKLVILMFEKSRARLCYVFVFLINDLNGGIKSVTFFYIYFQDMPVLGHKQTRSSGQLDPVVPNNFIPYLLKANNFIPYFQHAFTIHAYVLVKAIVTLKVLIMKH